MVSRRARRNRRSRPRRLSQALGAWVRAAARVGAVAAAIAAMGLGFVFVHDLVTQADCFTAGEVTIEGNRRLTAAQVLALAQVSPPVNVLSVNLPLARKRLLASPLIAQASVGRQLPDKLVIRIAEHVPMAAVDLGRLFLMDENGSVYKEKAEGDPADLPRVTGLKYGDLNPDGQAPTKPLQAVLEVLRMGSAKDCVLPNTKIQRIEVDRDLGLTLHVDQPIKVVRIGYRDYGPKYEKLAAILAYLAKNEKTATFEAIDLQNINRIVLNPGPPPAAGKDRKEV